MRPVKSAEQSQKKPPRGLNLRGRDQRRLRSLVPSYGENIAIDASDLPAFANGQRRIYSGGPYRPTFSDPDASWGHRSAISTRSGGGYYGFKLHAAICASTELPVAWKVETA